MRYLIQCGDSVIGESELERRDSSMGMVHGVFAPTPAYARVQPVFRIFAAAANSDEHDSAQFEEYYKQRDALRLEVLAESGELVSTAWVHIIDFALELGEMQIEVHLTDRQEYEQHFGE